MIRRGRPIKDFEMKSQVMRDNGFPGEPDDTSAWWRKFHDFCNAKKLRLPAVENHLGFDDYMTKVSEAGITHPSQIGQQSHQMQMGRYGDTGHYTPENCRFITGQQNADEVGINGGRARGVEKRRLGEIREKPLISTVHVQAKAFRLQSPDGDTVVGENISQFARTHNLIPAGMTQMLRGINSNHVGWTGEYDDTPEELILAKAQGIEVDAIIVKHNQGEGDATNA